MESISGYTESTLRSPPKSFNTYNAIEESCDQENVKPCTVILVDDDVDDLEMSSRALLKSDQVDDVHTVQGAEYLFEQMKDHGHFDNVDCPKTLTPIIIIDIHMPSINGIEMLGLIRDHPITCDFPVILLTSDVSGKTVQDAYDLKADGCLEKPFNLVHFRNILKNIDEGNVQMKVNDHYLA